MGKSGIKSISDMYSSAKDKREVFDRIEALVDEKTRNGALLTEGVGLVLTIGSRVFGRSLSSHPFFNYYTKHIDLLASVLNAVTAYGRAKAGLKKAIGLSKNAQRIRGEIQSYAARRQSLTVEYVGMLRPGCILANREDPHIDQLEIAKGFDRWQSDATELGTKALELFLMAKFQTRAIEATMAAVDKHSKQSKGFTGGHTMGYLMRLNQAGLAMDSAFAGTDNNLVQQARTMLREVAAEARKCSALATIAAKMSMESMPKELVLK